MLDRLVRRKQKLAISEGNMELGFINVNTVVT
jgi:hypothetical protein